MTEPFRPLFMVAPRAGRKETEVTRSILLWIIGIPIPIILLLVLCTYHF